jgi:hypothetical protein
MSTRKTQAGKNESTCSPVPVKDTPNQRGMPVDDQNGTARVDQANGQANPNKTGTASPVIEPEVPDVIQVGAGGKLIVPREDLDADLDDGAEIDLVNMQAKKIRKPGRREWIVLDLGRELPTRMLLHKPRPDAIETDYYYIDKALRNPIRDELKEVRVFPYYSLTAKAFALWIVNVTLENSWYESIAPLFKRPAEFFAQNAIRVFSERANSRYRVKCKPNPSDIPWPTKTTGELLAEALGSEHFIGSVDHAVYRELIEGTELD